MKLIIDIPDDYYEIIKHNVDNHLTDYRPFEIIGNGIPLDDVKAEIANMDGEINGYYVHKDDVLSVIDKYMRGEKG